MKVFANIDDQAIVIEDFLPEDLFKKVSNFDYESDKFRKRTSFDDWDKELYLDSFKNVTMKKVKLIDENLAYLRKGEYSYVKDDMFKDVLQTVVECPFMPFIENSTINVTYYKYEKYAGINWHDDHVYTLNYSLYIHKEWDRDWGGETLIDTNRGLPLCVTPRPNSLVAIKNNIQHKVCAVTGPEERRVLQIRGVFHE